MKICAFAAAMPNTASYALADCPWACRLRSCFLDQSNGADMANDIIAKNHDRETAN